MREHVRLVLDAAFVDWENPRIVTPQISWSFEPGVLLGVLALGASVCEGWRRARAAVSPIRPGFGRLALFAAGLLRDPRRARLADRRRSASS